MRKKQKFENFALNFNFPSSELPQTINYVTDYVIARSSFLEDTVSSALFA